MYRSQDGSSKEPEFSARIVQVLMQRARKAKFKVANNLRKITHTDLKVMLGDGGHEGNPRASADPVDIDEQILACRYLGTCTPGERSQHMPAALRLLEAGDQRVRNAVLSLLGTLTPDECSV